jgi:8-oxo-dGTP pyrophosphatase MutT (NUDIX family)
MAKKLKAYGICLYKKEFHTMKVLLCKSVNSRNKWGFLKGVAEEFETKEETALREFFEESSIEVGKKELEVYFEQTNKTKDIGIFLVNFDKIKGIYKYFGKEQLFKQYLSCENSSVKFFNIEELPPIKEKQTELTKEIINFLRKEK